MSLAADDRRYLWHPFTQQRGWEQEEPLIVAEADRCWLVDADGRRYIDGVSSLWCTVHGHRHPVLDLAVKDQLDRVGVAGRDRPLPLDVPPAPVRLPEGRAGRRRGHGARARRARPGGRGRRG